MLLANLRGNRRRVSFFIIVCVQLFIRFIRSHTVNSLLTVLRNIGDVLPERDRTSQQQTELGDIISVVVVYWRT